MFIVQKRAIFFLVSGLLVLASVAGIAIKGLHLGIDFKGGSIIELEYPNGRPAAEALNAALEPLAVEAHIQEAGENAYIIRSRSLDETKNEHSAVLGAASLGGSAQVVETRFNSVGPVIGQELRSKAWIALIVVVLGIVFFIAFAFRKVSEPVSSWKYGAITTVALLHDVIVPAGVFAWLGKEIDTLFVVGLLSILGLSVHDTIVVFDRVRENLKLKISNNFAETVGQSLMQTFTRSINTTLTIMIVLATLFVWGPESTRDFSLLLLVGMAIGTYSSVFLASPLLVEVETRQKAAGK